MAETMNWDYGRIYMEPPWPYPTLPNSLELEHLSSE